MTVFEFLRAKLPDFILPSEILCANLAARNIPQESDFDIGNKHQQKMLDLTYADCLTFVGNLPASISQGGFSMSLQDRKHYLQQAEALYRKHGAENQFLAESSRPNITNAESWY